MTQYELRRKIEQNDPTTKFFTRNNMKFAGDTMANFGVKGPLEINGIKVYELYRRKAVKCGNKKSFYFDAETFERVYDWKLFPSHGETVSF